MDAQILKKHSVEGKILGEYETSFAKKYLNPEHSTLVEKPILCMDLPKSVFELWDTTDFVKWFSLASLWIAWIGNLEKLKEHVNMLLFWLRKLYSRFNIEFL